MKVGDYVYKEKDGYRVVRRITGIEDGRVSFEEPTFSHFGNKFAKWNPSRKPVGIKTIETRFKPLDAKTKRKYVALKKGDSPSGLFEYDTRTILEKPIVPVMNPTENQKAVLTKIVAAETPKLAAADISKSSNLVSARDMLKKLGFITLDDEGAALTDEGTKVTTDQGLTDDMG